MSITIRHILPVINGFVAIPDGQILYPTAVTVQGVLANIPGSKLLRIIPGGATELEPSTYIVRSDDTHRTSHTSLYIELPSFDAPGQAGVDYFNQLRTIAAW